MSYLSDPTYLVSFLITLPVTALIGQSLFRRLPKEAKAARALATDRIAPPERHFNWGAFTFGWVWALAFRLPVATLIMFFSGVTLVPHLVFGFLAHDLAWNSSRQQNARDFTLTQLAWKQAALWVWFVVSLLCVVAALITLVYQGIAITTKAR